MIPLYYILMENPDIMIHLSQKQCSIYTRLSTFTHFTEGASIDIQKIADFLRQLLRVAAYIETKNDDDNTFAYIQYDSVQLHESGMISGLECTDEYIIIYRSGLWTRNPRTVCPVPTELKPLAPLFHEIARSYYRVRTQAEIQAADDRTRALAREIRDGIRRSLTTEPKS
jgi:hypothetical protein